MSRKKELANKRNALRSTGPRTEAGKARSRLNAIKHGAYAQMCLEGEDVSRFKVLLLDLLAEYKPLGFEETLLVNEIAQTIWRKNRFKAAEALAIHAYSFFKSQGEEQKGDVSLAIAQDASACGTIPRCLAAEDLLDRRLWAHFDRLRKIQKKRGFYPWKPLVITEGACDRPADKIAQTSGKEDARSARAVASADRANHAGTRQKGPPENDRDQPLPPQTLVQAEEIDQAPKKMKSSPPDK
jgi:hypothetical protein